MSLRTRLTLYYTGFFMCALLLLGVGVFMAVKESLERGVRSDLEAGAQQVLAIYWRSPASGLDFVIRNGMIGLVTPEQLSGRPAQIFVNPNVFVQVFSPDGEFLGSSMARNDFLGGGIDSHTQPIPLPAEALALSPNERLYITQHIDGVSVRSLIIPVGLAATGQTVGILQVTRSLEDAEETLHMLLTILLGGGGIALIGAALGIAGLSRTALTPIDQVVQTAQSIVRAEDLGQRVPVPATNDELHRLAVTMNELLERLEALFMMQRRLVADVSHELRTPLAAMQGNLEVLQRGAHRDPVLLNESLADMRQETARLIRMVNDLLLLAKSEARVEIRHDPVELDMLLLEVHRELRPLAGAVHLSIGAEDQVVVQGDRDYIKQALLNLGANAIQHTPGGGTVTLSLARCDDFACIAVQDTGSGIAPDVLPHIFKRFYRADPARARTGGGAGLGLAIVAHVAETHHGNINVESSPGEGSTFTLRLPLRDASADGTPARLDTGAARLPDGATDGVPASVAHGNGEMYHG
jgi:signal transduction histidine kinase